MAIFNSYVKLPEGTVSFCPTLFPPKKRPLDVSPGVQPDAISRNAAMKAVEHHWPMALELLTGFPVTAAAWHSRDLGVHLWQLL
jgi:hypothetical protein